MDALRTLLAVPGSARAEALRLALHGLMAQLRAAGGGDRDRDPGREACEALLRDLERLLDWPRGAGGEPPALFPDGGAPASPSLAAPPAAQSGGGSALARVRQVVQGDAEMAALYNPGVWPEDDAAFWTAAQLLGLRVPPRRRQAWQDALGRASGAVRPANTRPLPLPGSEVIFPGVGDGECRGWRADPGAPLDDRLEGVPDGPLRTLAGVVSVCLDLLGADDCLHHALYGLFMFGIKPLDDLERATYATELLSRWSRARATTDPTDRFLAWISLDEAIHSLVHRPVATRDSWWGQVQYQARATLDHACAEAGRAGLTVFTQALWGPYRGVRGSSEKDIQVDGGPAPPGEVLACLRVAAQVNGRAYPGRVVYRSAGG